MYLPVTLLKSLPSTRIPKTTHVFQLQVCCRISHSSFIDGPRMSRNIYSTLSTASSNTISHIEVHLLVCLVL